MAKSKLQYWLNEGKDRLTERISAAETDKQVYEAMGIAERTFYKYMQNMQFMQFIKKVRQQAVEDNTERLKQLHEDMWRQAHSYTEEETVKEVWTKGDKVEKKYIKTVTRTKAGDVTLQIYLDKTYGKNINSEEIESRIAYNKVRTEVNRLVLNPDIDEGTKAKLEAVREILGGVESVIGKTK